jgi:peptidylprolyl isomerase
MKKLITLVAIFFFSFLSNAYSQTEKNVMENLDSENTLYMQLKDGIVVIKMLPDIAPEHVNRIKTLVRNGFYDGLTFHRVIKDFMAQTGDPTGTGSGRSDWPNLYAEFSDEPHVRGAVSMARASDPNSANSQFFIVLKDSLYLDGKYTVWGRVVDGMQYVDNIKLGDSAKNGMVEDPDKIVWIKVASDLEKDEKNKGSALEKLKKELKEKVSNINIDVKTPNSALDLLGIEKK